jgi:hypothetical protein
MYDYLIARGFYLSPKMLSGSNSNLPVYGNYHSYAFLLTIHGILLTQLPDSYYSKRPFASDPRLSALPKGLFHRTTVLDIGCNEGWVTCEIGSDPAFLIPTFRLTSAVRK